MILLYSDLLEINTDLKAEIFSILEGYEINDNILMTIDIIYIKLNNEVDDYINFSKIFRYCINSEKYISIIEKFGEKLTDGKNQLILQKILISF